MSSVLLLAVLATAQRPVTKRPVARPVGPPAVLPTPVAPAQGAPLSSFQGTWLGSDSDSSVRRRVNVNGLRIRVSEACLLGNGQCDYEGDAVAYRPLRATPNDSTISALAVEYGDTLWRQTLILRQSAFGRLEAFVYTHFPDMAKRRSTYEHQLLTPATFMIRPPLAMPQFPWPPPSATAVLPLPDSLVAVPGRDSLGAVFDNLRVALTRVDVGWWSVYAIGPNGFAVVTRMEAIEADGRPKPGAERWSGLSAQETPRFSGIGDYLKALFSARPGFYRVIVFAVTDRPSGQTADGHGLRAREAEVLVAGGSDQLPAAMRRVPLGADGRCIALIYEFERPSESDTARFVPNAAIGALQHLTLAGLWTDEQLRK